jgi:hypothetical protein
MNTRFWIQGFFFDDWETMGPWAEGRRPVCPTVPSQPYPYTGVIWWDRKSGTLVGRMTDHIGASTLANVEIGDLFVRFEKRYERGRVIYYEFKERIGEVMAGRYEGDLTGQGLAWCRLTPIEDDGPSFDALVEVLKVDPDELRD